MHRVLSVNKHSKENLMWMNKYYLKNNGKSKEKFLTISITKLKYVWRTYHSYFSFNFMNV